ncbi:MAG: DinB family protein [Phycisphaerae bacterium]|nr:DinB family protein [Phycisphaerae bacterium]
MAHPHDAHNDEDGCCGQDSCCKGEGKRALGSGCCGGAAPAPLTPMSVAELEQLASDQLINRYRRGIENFDRRVFDLAERQIDQAFLPEAGVGQWPVRVLIGHCADADLASVHRMRRAVAEDNPVLSTWDENAFVDSNLYGNRHETYADTPEADHARVMSALGGHMAAIHTLRQWVGQWLLSLSEDQLKRQALHPERGPQSVRHMVASYTWHLEHHARFLTLKIDRMLGPAHTGQPSASACGCH